MLHSAFDQIDVTPSGPLRQAPRLRPGPAGGPRPSRRRPRYCPGLHQLPRGPWRQIRSNNPMTGSTGRSTAAPMSSGSHLTADRSSAWLGRSWPRRTTRGPTGAANSARGRVPSLLVLTTNTHQRARRKPHPSARSAPNDQRRIAVVHHSRGLDLARRDSGSGLRHPVEGRLQRQGDVVLLRPV
jgi:hypothetical protein